MRVADRDAPVGSLARSLMQLKRATHALAFAAASISICALAAIAEEPHADSPASSPSAPAALPLAAPAARPGGGSADQLGTPGDKSANAKHSFDFTSQKGPIDITSSSLSLDYKGKIIVWTTFMRPNREPTCSATLQVTTARISTTSSWWSRPQREDYPGRPMGHERPRGPGSDRAAHDDRQSGNP